MKRWVLTTVVAFSPTVGAVPTPLDVAPLTRSEKPGRSQYVSMLKVTVREATPELRRRSQRIVREKFSQTLSTFPELRQVPYEVLSRSDDVVFSFVTQQDILAAIRQVVPSYLSDLSGEVDAHGQVRVYKAAFDEPMEGERAFLEVVLDDSRSKIRSIEAQSVPLRDLLKELQAQLGNLSYLIPGECGGRLVDWRFGGEGQPGAEPKEVDALMQELATFFGLKSERKHGTFIFAGTCKEEPRAPTTGRKPVAWPEAASIGDWFLASPRWVEERTVRPSRPVGSRAPPAPTPRTPPSEGFRTVGGERPAVFFRLRAFE
jgi:hypothetical protein